MLEPKLQPKKARQEQQYIQINRHWQYCLHRRHKSPPGPSRRPKTRPDGLMFSLHSTGGATTFFPEKVQFNLEIIHCSALYNSSGRLFQISMTLKMLSHIYRGHSYSLQHPWSTVIYGPDCPITDRTEPKMWFGRTDSPSWPHFRPIGLGFSLGLAGPGFRV